MCKTGTEPHNTRQLKMADPAAMRLYASLTTLDLAFVEIAIRMVTVLSRGVTVRSVLFVLGLFLFQGVHADLPEAEVMPETSIDWHNTSPAQRQALDNFYQSLQNTQQSDQAERMRRLEQLRDMNTEQRQQMLRNLMQQRQLNRP